MAAAPFCSWEGRSSCWQSSAGALDWLFDFQPAPYLALTPAKAGVFFCPETTGAVVVPAHHGKEECRVWRKGRGSYEFGIYGLSGGAVGRECILKSSARIAQRSWSAQRPQILR